MHREARVPDVVYRVAGRHRLTQQVFTEDFCDLKTAQAQVKGLNAEYNVQIEYYIDAIRLDQLPNSKQTDLLDRGLITQAQFDRAVSTLAAVNCQESPLKDANGRYKLP